MPGNEPEPIPHNPDELARVLVDANVFGRRRWMEPLLDSARAGHILLIWSPAFIAEASRVLLWIWLQKRGGVMTDALKQEASRIAQRWFDHMTTVFRVVEDRPPHAPQWPSEPRDERDRPIWTAAVNAHADVVVTENLKDGPPCDDDGFQTRDHVMYLHPDRFIPILDWLGHSVETRRIPIQEREGFPAPDSSAATQLAPDVAAFLRIMEARARADLPNSKAPE